AGYTITKYLIDLGHRNIGFVGGSLASFRYKGFRKAMREAGLKCPESRVFIFEEGSIDGTAAAAKDFLNSNPEITALSCATDMRAIGVMKAAASLGKRVPDDLSVAGVDDISGLYPVSPALTTMHFPRKEVGRELVALADSMKSSGGVETRLLLTSLAKKDSCCKF
ncbi:MAG: substrate-binding domain-containing protein, partial [Candidatus Izemoplasmatales bacterium]|nr:substrate-binding domain-containing protein [Candidatus Izemoplasmatales bacterium]